MASESNNYQGEAINSVSSESDFEQVYLTKNELSALR
jgi:hypothetical protein